MITKKELLGLIDQYKLPVLSRISKAIGGSPYPKEMRSLYEFVKSLPKGKLSPAQLLQIKGLLIDSTDEETRRVFNLIKTKLSINETAPGYMKWLYHSWCALTQVWHDSYFYDRPQAALSAWNEVAIRRNKKMVVLSKQNKIYLENVFAVLYFTISFYGATRTQYAFLFAGKLSQLLSQAVTIHSYQTTRSLLTWFMGLGLQIGIDWKTGAGGLFTVSYVLGSFFDMTIGYVSSRFLYNGDYYNAYPATFLCTQKLLQDLGYSIGVSIACKIYLPMSPAQSFLEPPTNKDKTVDRVSEDTSYDAHVKYLKEHRERFDAAAALAKKANCEVVDGTWLDTVDVIGVERVSLTEPGESASEAICRFSLIAKDIEQRPGQTYLFIQDKMAQCMRNHLENCNGILVARAPGEQRKCTNTVDTLSEAAKYSGDSGKDLCNSVELPGSWMWKANKIGSKYLSSEKVCKIFIQAKTLEGLWRDDVIIVSPPLFGCLSGEWENCDGKMVLLPPGGERRCVVGEDARNIGQQEERRRVLGL